MSQTTLGTSDGLGTAAQFEGMSPILVSCFEMFECGCITICIVCHFFKLRLVCALTVVDAGCTSSIKQPT